MKSKGFIAMSIVYSFFIVFISVTAIILANYMQNRILINELNEEIKVYLGEQSAK